MPAPHLIHSFPRAILHVDGDSFFASCEITKNPSLRGRPVVTGSERGIATSMTYEAKKLGITRATKIADIRKYHPEVVVVESDYESYELYSQRMYEIVGRYTEAVEQYSIDECFADLTGMRRPNNMSYEEMAHRIYTELADELGITFSVGLSVNKVVAKMASKMNKPHGLTIIPGRDLAQYLAKVSIDKIWGIGPQTTAYLVKLGIKTALDFASKAPEWVATHLSKPGQDIHAELNGEFINPLTIGPKHDYASIQRVRTFRPTRDREFLYAQLSNNIEHACIRLRSHNLYAKRFSFFLKSQEFRYYGLEIKIDREVNVPEEILSVVKEKFDTVFRKGMLYRSTGITLGELTHERVETLDLFGRAPVRAKIEKIHEAIDEIDARYGKQTVFLGSSWRAREEHGRREEILEPDNQKVFNIPYWGHVG